MHIRVLKARKNYTCAKCGSRIRAGTYYLRDEPHPMARLHHAVSVLRLCAACAPGPVSEYVATMPTSEQLRLPFEAVISSMPPVLLQAAIIDIGGKTDEGHLVEAVRIPWFEIIQHMAVDPEFLFKVPWRELEELIAGAYEREGWEKVTLTPRSGDRGRDIIVEKRGVCAIRVVDQVKAYAPDRRVSADDIRALLGVLEADSNVSKGIVTTTARFAPGIFDDPGLMKFMPYRLELKDGDKLREWLIRIWRGVLNSA